jgi:hypothetical protein
MIKRRIIKITNIITLAWLMFLILPPSDLNIKKIDSIDKNIINDVFDSEFGLYLNR